MKAHFKWLALRIVSDNPVRVLISIYCFVICAGFLLLSLPICQKVSTSFIDNFFTAASAVSTTGLTTVSTADNYNFLGQLIILLLIQIGGIHYMTFGSLILLAYRKKISKFQEELIKGDFGLPDGFDVTAFIKSVVVFSLSVEIIGAGFLYYVFYTNGVENPLWNAVFHSISAFCTAGFSLFNTSLERFATDGLLNIVIIILSVLGACGFIVVTDYWQKLTRQRAEVTFTTKIIISFTFLGVLAGAFLLFCSEAWFDHFSWNNKLWLAVFQAMTALTTVGFNTFPIAQMSHGAVLLLAVLMLFGASPAGTGGGIKSTTVVAVVAQTIQTLRGKVNVTVFGRQVPSYRLRIASASFIFYMFILIVGIYLLALVEKFPIFELGFEAASALGTVGLSMGITGGLSFLGKVIISGLMILGRIGPLTIGLALFYSKKKEPDDIGWHEDVVVT